MPVLICLRKELWTGLISVGDQVPTCPVFTRAKIKSRFGIIVNLPSQYTPYFITFALYTVSSINTYIPNNISYKVNFLLKTPGFYDPSSSSSCHAIGTDIPDPSSQPLPTIHCFWQVLRATPHILTELLYVGLSWLPCFCSAMWRGPPEYIT